MYHDFQLLFNVGSGIERRPLCLDRGKHLAWLSRIPQPAPSPLKSHKPIMGFFALIALPNSNHLLKAPLLET